MDRYAPLWLTCAFISGALLTLGLKDFYPDLEQRFTRRLRQLRQSRADTNDEKPEARDAITLWSEDGAAAGPLALQIGNGVEGTIGNTPMFKLKALSEATGCEILAKAEYLNGAGNSPKDRVALSIIETAERHGQLRPHSGDVIYEGTVGSTGISLAAICRARGYLAHIFMPSDQSPEKSNLLLKLGARVDRVPPNPITSPEHFVNQARSRAAAHTADPSRPGRGYFADQFENPANWLAHRRTTGPEIAAQTGRRLDAFVAGAGTGGTMSGVALHLKRDLGLQTRCVVADPQGSGLYNRVRFGVMFDAKEREGTRRRHQVDSIVEGIGCNRVTANFEEGYQAGVVDDAVRVSDEEAKRMGRWLVEREGVFVGSSSAVNCFAALKVAREMGPGHRIVTILCDPGTRHLSRFWADIGDTADHKDMTLNELLGA